MPYTPYHFGPSGFLGLVFRKYIDLPVFLFANIVVDIEVLCWQHWPVHRAVHTLLTGAIAGIIWGLVAYPLRNIFAKLMQIIHLSYKTSLLKMIVSGVLGIWLHVIIDAPYNWDVRLFWPSRTIPLYGLISKSNMQIVCIAFWVATIVVYIVMAANYRKEKTSRKTTD
jgi:H+/Cl- antiporter ClcA